MFFKSLKGLLCLKLRIAGETLYILTKYIDKFFMNCYCEMAKSITKDKSMSLKLFNTKLLATATGAVIASTAAVLLPTPAQAACIITDPTDPITPCGFLLRASSVLQVPNIFGPTSPGYSDLFFITFSDNPDIANRLALGTNTAPFWPQAGGTVPPFPPNSLTILDQRLTYAVDPDTGAKPALLQVSFYPDSSLTGTPTIADFRGTFRLRIIDRGPTPALGTFGYVVEDGTFAITLPSGDIINASLIPDVTRPSVGQITIADNGNGTFRVESNALIRPQFNLNGGPNQIIPESSASSQPATPIPEGSSVWGLLALGSLGVVLAGKRRLN
jgi:hypothetical protein